MEKHISRKDIYEFPQRKEEGKLQVEKAQSIKAQRMRNQNLENLWQSVWLLKPKAKM